VEDTLEPAGQTPEICGTILCIEDNAANLRLVERILGLRPGLTLLSAMDGRHGLELARAHRPRLILLDLHLPDLAGDEVLAQLLADSRTREIPVVILSADAGPRRASRLLSQGARRYLTKPLNVEELLALLDEILGEHRMLGSPER
jgi:CheY-like chemotaxis protein